jgi:hypothetical protein
MSNRATRSGAGTGWREVYLNGSREAEEELVRRRFAPEINRIQRDIERIERRGRIKRAQHSKMIAGTKNAEFRVLPAIPEDLRVGLFQPGASYRAHVRFSNAAGIEQPDAARDLRGLAIRVRTEAGDHDFLATNAPYSHARDARQFMIISSAIPRVGRPAFLWRLRAWRTPAALARIARRLGPREALRVLRTIRQQTSRPVSSLAAESYWSRAPFAFGDDAALAFGPVAVKFKLEPVPPGGDTLSAAAPAPDLRAELMSRLERGDVQFDFKVQRYLDDASTPIEDGTVEWKETAAPFVTLARLLIPAQHLDPADERDIDALSFNPWNTASAAIRPLGSLNRARNLVYQASARLRQAR